MAAKKSTASALEGAEQGNRTTPPPAARTASIDPGQTPTLIAVLDEINGSLARIHGIVQMSRSVIEQYYPAASNALWAATEEIEHLKAFANYHLVEGSHG